MLSYNNFKNLIYKFEPETAHNIIEKSSKFADILGFVYPLLNKFYHINNPILSQNILGLNYANPVGIAAGFDKNATMLNMLKSLGFGHIEYGAITPKAQDGNEKPRLFRFVEEESIQNAMGFNNIGLEAVLKNINYPFATPLWANIGKNKTSQDNDILQDYIKLIQGLNDKCDVFVINISSPNTPNLRDLQNENFIKELFSAIIPLTKKAIFLKISPDESLLNLCKTAVECGAKGIIATNTSLDYTLLKNPKQRGGISGKALKEKSFKIFEEISKELFGKCELVSVGGIDSADEAYKRIKAGASLIQIYSALIFKGPSVVKNINDGLVEFLKKDGFISISQAIGIERK